MPQPATGRAQDRRTGVPTPDKQTTTPPSVAVPPSPRASPSRVLVEKTGDNVFRYLVNGEPQVFIGMGYNPIYRYLSDQERAANYDRDFRILCQAGVNHITGWDADKGYEQDKFDELTLDYAHKYGIGVVMPFFLPFDGDYFDEAFRRDLLDQAATKVVRFRDHPALRMWGVGNEVFLDGLPPEMTTVFGRFYLELADLIHGLDPNHPVIYREGEDIFVPIIVRFLQRRPPEREWLLYAMNVYTTEIERILDTWPDYGFDRPLFVSEFGAEEDWPGGRAMGYVDMWRMIRSHPDYVMGGAPYVWTTEGPEPTDQKWGLMDGDGRPVDDTFSQLSADWLEEDGAGRT
ncbi:MAG: glycoside hydrolase family 2 TIM barrel-domain containing protein [Dehalococcoidia bacterium]|nr:glycoside hydrolase family 2 TIM barrel-domain containing protein [Dehalococcoidia bacterium]